MRYLRLEKNDYSIITSDVYTVIDTDISLTAEEYEKYKKMQLEGKIFKINPNPVGNTLFDLLVSEQIRQTPEVETVKKGVEDYLLDLEYRTSKLELGVNK